MRPGMKMAVFAERWSEVSTVSTFILQPALRNQHWSHRRQGEDERES